MGRKNHNFLSRIQHPVPFIMNSDPGAFLLDTQSCCFFFNVSVSLLLLSDNLFHMIIDYQYLLFTAPRPQETVA